MSWIREGEHYRTRDGQRARVVRLATLQFGFQQRLRREVWVGHVGNDTREVTWDMQGKFADECDHPLDLMRRAAKKTKRRS